MAVLATVSCGGDGRKALQAVTPTPTPTPTVTLSGTVRETAPTQSTPIAGATVTIITGPFVGKSATTDANGGFQLTLSPGDVNVVVRAANYGTSELTSFDPNTALPFVQLYRANNGQPSSSIAVGANTPGQPISATVEAHSQYVLLVRIFSDGGGPPPAGVTSHSLTVKHPS